MAALYKVRFIHPAITTLFPSRPDADCLIPLGHRPRPLPNFSTSQPTSLPTPLSADGAQTMDFTCVETQVGNGDPLDCEIVELDGAAGFYHVQLPQC